MLDCAGDDVRVGRSRGQREIVGLGRACGEDDVGGLGPHEVRDARTRVLDIRTNLAAGAYDADGLAKHRA